jgi:SdrD B-like protein
MRRIISAALLLCLGTAPVLLSTPAFADTTGATICGNTWQDLNGDGIHQAKEPAMPNVGLSIGSGPFINTSSDNAGNYCFTNVAPGTYQVQANDLAFVGGFDWTLPGHDSHVDWTDGTSAPITVTSTTDIEHFDVGYVKSTADLRAGQITISRDGRPVHTTRFHVGDTFQIFGAMKVTGNIPDGMSGTLTVPDGLTVLDTAGNMPSQVLGAHQVFGQAHERLLPGTVEFIGATVRVDAAFDSGAITLNADLTIFDTNPNNDVRTLQISAS